MYTTCMHALRMHFLPATGLYGLARGSAAAAQRFGRQPCALRGDYDSGFCALSAVLRVCDGAGAKAAAPMARAAMIAVFILSWSQFAASAVLSMVFDVESGKEARPASCIGAPRV